VSDHPAPPVAARPAHRNPSSPERTASAPYNFVPLPEMVVPAAPDATALPGLDSYGDASHSNSGYFTVTLTTRSPLYIRAPLTREQFDRQDRGDDRALGFRDQVKNLPDFFYTEEPSRPVIPGSSLRGMLRALLEIVGYGKLQPITARHLFYRSVDDSTLGREYRARMVGSARARPGETKVEAGFLQRGGEGYRIRRAAKLRVHHETLRRADRRLPAGLFVQQRYPSWEYQYRFLSVMATEGSEVTDLSFQSRPNGRPGMLVISGFMPNKRHEHIFLLPADDAETIDVDEDLIRRFEDDDQLTQWQEQAFPRDRPKDHCRERAGTLLKPPPGDGEPGEPVFFLREKGKLTFFGRAGMFRLPYQHAPVDLIPDALRDDTTVDDAEAIFGYVGKGPTKAARAGRVSITDAHLVEDQGDVWLSPTPLVPKILATPKPTAFQHYLVQTTDISNRLFHYDSPQAILRGHKLYWHQGERTARDLAADAEPGAPPVPPTSTQHTQLKPLRAGVCFQFRVYFENLSERELGALCWVLHPLGDPNRMYYHHLGMGKPLGMGAVQLTATLHRIDRRQRYTQLFDGDAWATGETTADDLTDRPTLERSVAPFERHLLDTLGLPALRHLSELKRIGMLLKLLEWPGVPPRYPATPDNRPENSRTMLIQIPGTGTNEFRNRPVLPDPSAFGELTGDAEPGRPPTAPPAGSGRVAIRPTIPAPSRPSQALPLRSPPDRPDRSPSGVRPAPRADGSPTGLPTSTAPPTIGDRVNLAPPSAAPVRSARVKDRLMATVTSAANYKVRVRLPTVQQEEVPLDFPPGRWDWIQRQTTVPVEVTDVDQRTGKVTKVKLR
jgi:CRISPR-associated protein (TIGR03986 family)